MAKKNSVKIMVTFAERGKGKILEKMYTEHGATCSFLCMGRGTASSELLDVLGVGSTEKDILITLLAPEVASRLRNRLDNDPQGDSHGRGIAFDMPLTGMNSIIASALLNNQERTVGGNDMDTVADHNLILVAVNQGHTDAVMDTAREAGAGGGTVIKARWAGAEDTSQFHGISLQTEKEIIAIVTSTDRRNTIMEMINKKHGLKTEAGAVVLSLAIDHLMHIG